jgi:hypothetical protein
MAMLIGAIIFFLGVCGGIFISKWRWEHRPDIPGGEDKYDKYRNKDGLLSVKTIKGR